MNAMDDAQTPSPTAPIVVATRLDEGLERLVAAAALRASAAATQTVPEDEARRRIEAGAADLIVVGDAPSGSLADAMVVAERLAQVADAIPMLLLVRSDMAPADALRLAAHGIETLAAGALDADALARRLLLAAHTRALRERGRRAHALVRVHESLIAGLVHDLRTPLMAINLSAEVASARSADDAVRQAMRRIRSSTQRMGRALDHVSNIAHLDAPLLGDVRETVDLGAVARHAVEAVRRDHVDSEVDVAEIGDLRVRADPAALQHVVTYVLATAVAHAHDERIGVRIDGSAAHRLWFEVTMPRAIPPDVQERLSGDATRDRPGLGLHAIEAIVRAHAGSVVGRSKAPEGTVFELLLPRGVDD